MWIDDVALRCAKQNSCWWRNGWKCWHACWGVFDDKFNEPDAQDVCDGSVVACVCSVTACVLRDQCFRCSWVTVAFACRFSTFRGDYSGCHKKILIYRDIMSALWNSSASSPCENSHQAALIPLIEANWMKRLSREVITAIFQVAIESLEGENEGEEY